MLRSGAVMARLFLTHRKPIQYAMASFFFPSLDAEVGRERCKKLFNLLDMDGTLSGWWRMYRADIPSDRHVRDFSNYAILQDSR